MINVSNHNPSSLVSAGARWVESRLPVTRRRYKIVALCNTDLLGVVQQQLQKALGRRTVKDSVTKLVACDRDLSRLSVEFDADDSERNDLSSAVCRLCTMPGVRYVRLDPHST